MVGCFLARFADDPYVQAPSNDLCDLSSRYALIGHCVICSHSRTFLEHEPVEMSCIEPMHCCPAVEPVVDKCGNACYLLISGMKLCEKRGQERCAISIRAGRSIPVVYVRLRRNGHSQPIDLAGLVAFKPFCRFQDGSRRSCVPNPRSGQLRRVLKTRTVPSKSGFFRVPEINRFLNVTRWGMTG